MDPGGGAGIRTLGIVTPAGFQEQNEALFDSINIINTIT